MYRSVLMGALACAVAAWPATVTQTTRHTVRRTVQTVHTEREREVVLAAGTRIPVRLDQSLDTKRDRPGTPFVAETSAAIVHNGEVIVPRGAICRGHLVQSKASGRLKGRAVMQLQLDSIQMHGRVYTVPASGPVFVSKAHGKHNAAWIGGGAGTGAAIGGIAGGGVGALIGAGAGAAAGTTGAVITGKRQLRLAPETRVTFSLRQPLRVYERPLSAAVH